MNPRISVVTPAYDEGEKLLQCYAGLLTQTVTDWEWIVVDDGSTESVEALLAPMGDDRIRVRTLPKRRGQGAARNAGLEIARGALVANQDPGDWSLPQRFEMQLGRLEAEPDLAAVGTFMFAAIPGMDVALWRSYEDAMIHPSLMLRKDVFATVSYDPRRKVGEDLGFTHAVDEQFDWAYLDKPLAAHDASSDLGFGHYARTQWSAWKADSPSIRRAVGIVTRVGAFGLARLLGKHRQLIRRRYNDLTPDQLADFAEAQRTVNAKLAELRALSS